MSEFKIEAKVGGQSDERIGVQVHADGSTEIRSGDYNDTIFLSREGAAELAKGILDRQSKGTRSKQPPNPGKAPVTARELAEALAKLPKIDSTDAQETVVLITRRHQNSSTTLSLTFSRWTVKIDDRMEERWVFNGPIHI